MQERLDVAAAEDGGQLALIGAGGSQVRRQPGDGVDDVLDPGVRAGPAVAGHVIGGPPLGGLPQPALADGGERQLPPRAEQPPGPTRPSSTSARVSPSALRT